MWRHKSIVLEDQFSARRCAMEAFQADSARSVANAAIAHLAGGLPRSLQLIEQRRKPRRRFRLSAESHGVIYVREFADSAAERAGGQRCRKLGGREPWRLLIAAALDDRNHLLVKQRSVSGARFAAADALHPHLHAQQL